MNELKIFENKEFGEVRVIEQNGKPWFVGKDIADILGYSDPSSAVSKKIDVEDRGLAEMATPSGTQEMTIINESGMYSLILGSKLESAKKFKRWVTSEVLPSIRKHGAYMTEQALEEAILNPDTIIKIATALKEEKEKNKRLQITNSALTVDKQIMQPKAEYFDELVDRNLLTNFRETAKQLEIKEKAFITFLLDKKYVYRDKRGKLMPHAQYTDSGLFNIKECYNDKTEWSGTQTLVTPKGRETFRLLYLKSA